MSNEIARLKVELEALNLQCQLARDHEIRYALQRTRLEADRVKLLIGLCEAAAARHASAIESTPTAEARRNGARAVTIPAKPEVSAAKQRQKRKPAGLPTVAEMVLAILEGEGAGMRPRDIARIARRKWWPDLRAAAVNAAVWKLAGSGRLEKDGHLYKLNGHAGE